MTGNNLFDVIEKKVMKCFRTNEWYYRLLQSGGWQIPSRLLGGRALLLTATHFLSFVLGDST